MHEQRLKSNGYTEPSEAQEKTIRVLSEMSVRLQTIEHRMEVLHMLPPPVTKKRRVSALILGKNM